MLFDCWSQSLRARSDHETAGSVLESPLYCDVSVPPIFVNRSVKAVMSGRDRRVRVKPLWNFGAA